ncbi:MAG: 6-pyruvoyl-tetrahydropterin synthase-related protein [bacterium]|nr:6-pyruvoyl-tetrahydropterin synthase-related protein [bacterium]
MKRILGLKFNLIILAILLLFSGRFFLSDKLFDTHDLEYHAARTANYYLALQQGQFPPRWSPNLNYSFGLPTFMFAYPLPYFVATAFFLLIGNIQLSINVTLLFFWCVGAVGMFYYAKVRTNLPHFSLLVAVSYFAAPYTLLNFFERGAFGETSFFALLPLVLLTIHWQNKIKSGWYVLCSYVVCTAFLLTHPQSLAVTIPILIIWILNRYKKTELRKFWVKKIMLIGAIALSVQFFWTPLLFESSETLVSESISVQRLLQSFPVFSRLFWPAFPASQVTGSQMLVTDFPTTLGLSMLLLFLGGGYALLGKQRTKHHLFWLVIFLLSVFFMHPVSSFVWERVGSLKIIQFPWRLLSLSVLASTMLLIESRQALKSNQLVMHLFSILFFCLSLANLYVWGKPKGYISRTDYEWFEYFGTASSFDEFIPKGFDHGKNLQVTDQLSLIPAGNAQISAWNGSRMEYQIKSDDPTWVLQKTAYFPGWKVFVDDSEVDINHSSAEFPGRITFLLPPGGHLVTVRFTNQTPIRQVADSASLLGLGILCALLFTTVDPAKVSGILRRRRNT